MLNEEISEEELDRMVGEEHEASLERALRPVLSKLDVIEAANHKLLLGKAELRPSTNERAIEDLEASVEALRRDIRSIQSDIQAIKDRLAARPRKFTVNRHKETGLIEGVIAE
jgi:hypothetical protein